MKMEQKLILEKATAGSSSRAGLKAALVGRNEAQAIEIQASLASLTNVSIESLSSLAVLATEVSGGSAPDVVLIDMDPEQAQDITLLQDLRKLLPETPIVAVTNRVTEHGPLRAIRAGASDVLIKPIALDDAREVLDRVMQRPKRQTSEATDLGKVVVFMHLGGGVGATTLAVNSAFALTGNQGKKSVCLLDLDLQFGSAGSLLDLPSSPVQEFVDAPQRLDFEMLEGLLLKHPTGLRVLTAPSILLPISAYTPEGVKLLIELARRRFGFVVIDLPVALAPWTDAVLRMASVVNVVLSGSVPSIHRLVRFLNLLREDNLSDVPLKLILNRYQRDGKGNDISLSQFEKAIGRKPDFLVPNDYSLVSTSHGQGKPAASLKPDSSFAVSIRDMLNAELGGSVFERKRRGFAFLGRSE